MIDRDDRLNVTVIEHISRFRVIDDIESGIERALFLHLSCIHRGDVHEILFHKEHEVSFEKLQIGVMGLLINILEIVAQRYGFFRFNQTGTSGIIQTGMEDSIGLHFCCVCIIS